MNNMESLPIHNIYSKKLSNIRDDSRYKLDSNYLQYIIWIIITLFLVILSFHTYNSDGQSILVQLVAGVVATMILYKLFNTVYHKLFLIL